MKGLLFITQQTEEYSHKSSAALALKHGCRQIQLRNKEEKDSLKAEITARWIKLYCDYYNADLYINDDVELCQIIGAKGVHLGKDDMSPIKARSILGKDFVIGGTANTFDDILRLHDSGVDYIGLGPFRFTSTKVNLSPVLGIEGYESIINLCLERDINTPIIAVGGITLKDIEKILNVGVAGVAMSSAILNAKNHKREIAKIIKTIYGEENIDDSWIPV